jgi:uncharacterized protein (DUF1810 family)
MTDPFDLARFVDAQDGGTYERALSELHAGRKTSHWMWFVFPQVAGLGRSETAVRYAVSGLDEAAAYWAHDVLGRRYDECCDALLALGDVSMTDVLGPIDAQKLHSSLTLFAEVASPSTTIEKLLVRHHGGERDLETTSRLAGRP